MLQVSWSSQNLPHQHSHEIGRQKGKELGEAENSRNMPGGLLQAGLNFQSVRFLHREGNGLRMGLGAAVANHVGRTWLCQALHSRGEVVVGQEIMGSLLETGSKARARDQVHTAWG